MPMVVSALGLVGYTHSLLNAANRVQPAAPRSGEPIESAIKLGRKYFQAGDLGKSEQAFEQARLLSEQAHDRRSQALAYFGIGSCRLLKFQYRQAFHDLLQAKRLALEVHDHYIAGGVTGNLSSIHFHLNELDAAIQDAEEAVRLLEKANRPDYLIHGLINLGSLKAERKDLPAMRKAYQRAIAIAEQAHDKAELSQAWDYLGGAMLDASVLQEAERDLNEAYRLRLMDGDPKIVVTRARLALLALKKDEPAKGLRILDDVLASGNSELAEFPRYQFIHDRGQMLEALNRRDEALQEYRKAVELAVEWRFAALPGDVANLSTVSYLNDIYGDFTSLAIELGLKRNNPALVQEALEVLAQNRTASLSEEVTLAFERQDRIPPRYLELLTQLQNTQASVTLLKKSSDEAKLQKIRVDLENVENEMYVQTQNSSLGKENIRSQKTLSDIQHRLRDNDVLLSFFLGRRNSYLWAVDRTSLSAYRLPAEAELLNQANAFSTAVQARDHASKSGERLSQSLFGQLSSRYSQKKTWLLVGDGKLMGAIPFAALPEIVGSGRPLVKRHNLRFLPSEWSTARNDVPQSSGSFVGIGDPVYNLADMRIRRRDRIAFAFNGAPSAPALARLVGSEREVRTAAQSSQANNAAFLVGPQASTSQVQNILAKRPAIVHFAVHVVSPPEHPEQAALALSLGRGGVPELVTPEQIATWRVPGSLVILSGCSSQQGKALPGAGLVGLSRSWLLAGASAVVVSAWPTPDDSGKFFSSFYDLYRREAPGPAPIAERAAHALQLAQLEMQQHVGGYRSSPQFWAAYSVLSKE